MKLRLGATEPAERDVDRPRATVLAQGASQEDGEPRLRRRRQRGLNRPCRLFREPVDQGRRQSLLLGSAGAAGSGFAGTSSGRTTYGSTAILPSAPSVTTTPDRARSSAPRGMRAAASMAATSACAAAMASSVASSSSASRYAWSSSYRACSSAENGRWPSFSRGQLQRHPEPGPPLGGPAPAFLGAALALGVQALVDEALQQRAVADDVAAPEQVLDDRPARGLVGLGAT